MDRVLAVQEVRRVLQLHLDRAVEDAQSPAGDRGHLEHVGGVLGALDVAHQHGFVAADVPYVKVVDLEDESNFFELGEELLNVESLGR